MKKFSTVVLTLLLAVSLATPVFAETTDQGNKNDAAEVYGQGVFDNALAVTSKTMKVKKTKGLTASIKYPLIKEMEDKRVQKAVNKVFLQEAQKALKEGRRSAAKLKKRSVTKCETIVGFTVKYNRDGILSVVMDKYQFAGGAHGETTRICKSFDLTTGKVLTLQSVFSDYEKGKSAINQSVRADTDMAKKDGLTELKTFKSISDKQSFFFSDRGLTVVFQQGGSYFSYGDGAQLFTVPYEKLSQYFDQDYVGLALEKPELKVGKASALTEGQFAYIVVDSNPTTGYTWSIRSSDDKVVRVVSQRYIPEPTATELAGAGGKEVIIVKALSKGTAKVQCTYGQNWEGGKQDKTLEYDVIVK